MGATGRTGHQSVSEETATQTGWSISGIELLTSPDFNSLSRKLAAGYGVVVTKAAVICGWMKTSPRGQGFRAGSAGTSGSVAPEPAVTTQ